jgi:hypothetical protein
MAAQAATLTYYFRTLADKDISADPFSFSLDETTWVSGTYVPVGSLPPKPAAVHAANPVPTGFTAYWWSVLTGPTTQLAVQRGEEQMFGRATDNPDSPHFGWVFQVPWYA